MAGNNMFVKINYQDQLNDRQKENYNFQKASAQLADYGFNCLRLSDDWQGADFIACHIDGNTFLKIQLKGRLTFNKKYIGKNLYIVFCEKNVWYIYPHDKLFQELSDKVLDSDSWELKGEYHWRYLTKELMTLMRPYTI